MAKALADIRSLARTHTKMAVKVLVGIAKSPNAADSARVAAASALLDRGWGKPKQEQEITVRRVMAKELPDDELANIALGSSEGIAAPPIDPSQLN